MSVCFKLIRIALMKHSLVRQTIIETASDLFYRKGYNLTGINEIIKEAGIAKATLYNHFQSKDDICIAYLQHMNTAFLVDIEAFALKAPGGKKQLMALFDFLIEFFHSKSFNGCWCINTVSEIPIENQHIRKEIKHQKEKFLELIQWLMKTNFPDKTEEDNQKLAMQVYLLYEAAVSESYLHQDVWPIDSAKNLCKQML